MNKNTNYFGIDISKDVFDVMDGQGIFYQFKNNPTGFKKMLALTDACSHCVMESTGVYHLRLAYYLLENGVKVSVENPLSIKRFIQMKLSKVKTDKKDAKMIYLYAENQHCDLKLWKGQGKVELECSHLMSLSNLYTKQVTAFKNKLHTQEAMGSPSKRVIRSINRSIKHLKTEIDNLEAELLKLVKKEDQDLLTRVESIPGIGRKSSVLLIVLTGGLNVLRQPLSYALIRVSPH